MMESGFGLLTSCDALGRAVVMDAVGLSGDAATMDDCDVGSRDDGWIT